MLVSCLCVCHNKPDITHEAIQSILHQSYPYWEALVVDSGVLYDAGYYDAFTWRHDPRIQLIRSAETDEIRRTKAMAPWCYNECFRKGLVKGDLVMYLCDDDLLYPDAFATFVSYCRQHPDARAMYASQDVVVIYPNGWRTLIGERRATRPGGRSCGGRPMDCHVDYLQFCHKADVLHLLPSPEYWPEGKETESHADGIFMERIGEQVPIFPIDVKVSQNRRTPHSVNVPLSSFAMIDGLANGIPLAASPMDAGPEIPEATLPRTHAHPTTAVLEDAPLVTLSVACCNESGCLSETLASVAAQTYPNLQVLIISTDDASARVFETVRSRDRRFRFLHATCADRGTMRDRGLWEAQGVYFIPMDAGTLACPDMVERFVAEMRRRPGMKAMTCYLLALELPQDPSRGTADGASLSTRGRSPLASTKNIYGGGIFDTASLRDVGGHGSEQETPGQDWIGFLRLVNAGYQVGIFPEHLFYYRPGPTGSVRSQDDAARVERVLRPFFQADRLLAAERIALWTAFAGMQARLEEMRRRLEELTEQNEALHARCGSLRYQVADRLARLCDRVPLARRSLQWLLRWRRQTQPNGSREDLTASDRGSMVAGNR